MATTEKHKIIPTILSRCQIFDFNRIQVKDIADHLASIAGKEGIKAEAQALHLIAQKADGALRDALSIFDLIVTFSAGNAVTYKTTIENLHILDYDYYFRMVDYLNTKDLSNTLLTFDEIIRNGFDGHNFIVGLSEHLRNLMVSKDKATIKLIEVADEIKKKYAAQADSVSLSFIMSCLSIANDCDLHYKASKNQRLHVELALMKMAYLNSILDTSKTSPEEVKKKSDSLKEDAPEQAKDTAPSSAATAAKFPAEPAKTAKSTLKLPSLSSLKEEVKEPTQVYKKQEEPTEQARKDTPFTQEQLTTHWNEFAAKLKQEGKNNEYIAFGREVMLGENYSINIRLENDVQQDWLLSLKVEVLEFLRKKLNNNILHLVPVVLQSEAAAKPFTSKEKYNRLAEKYPVMDDLRKTLGLDLDH